MPIPVPTTTIHQVESALGMAAPADPAPGSRRARAREAVSFFYQFMSIERADEIISHLEGIDLDWPVRRVDLLPPTELIAYRYNPQRSIAYLDPFGMYFARVGTGKDILGIRVDDRRFIRYVVTSRIPALESRVKTGFVSHFGAVFGGAVQYVIPRASRHLRVVHIQNTLKS